MERLDQTFKYLLRHHNVANLENYDGVIYGVWQNYSLAYLNPAWFRFAEENGGEPSISKEWGLGRSIMDSVSGDIKELYETKFKNCLDSETVWSHDYECSSDMIYRCYRQIVYPLENREGLLIVNSLVASRLHDPEQRQRIRVDNESDYLDENGFFCQCAYCRRVKNFTSHERWDWVPEWVKRCPEHTSHTFCPTCYVHYFPKPESET